jgi:hypothetical protein
MATSGCSNVTLQWESALRRAVQSSASRATGQLLSKGPFRRPDRFAKPARLPVLRVWPPVDLYYQYYYVLHAIINQFMRFTICGSSWSPSQISHCVCYLLVHLSAQECFEGPADSHLCP